MTMKNFNRLPQELCFTANAANSSVKLVKNGSPTTVSIEISTDGATWSDYTMWDIITLSNIWDKVYMRNKSETTTNFSTSNSNYYQFSMTWSIAAHWSINYLLCKNSTDTLPSDHCFRTLFYNCTSLAVAPSLPATTITQYCYLNMFMNCTTLEVITELPATTLTTSCYRNMFRWCSKIKLSTTQAWEYQTEYRIPTSWTWTTATNAFDDMFYQTGWTFTWTPSINTTYYTSNTLV